MPLIVRSPIKPTQEKSQFWFQVWHFSVRISDYFVSLSVSSLNNLELNKTETVKTIVKQENLILRLTLSPGFQQPG